MKHLIFTTDQNKANQLTNAKPKRKRIAPIQFSSVDYRIKQKQAELGLTKYDIVLNNIRAELTKLGL